MSEKVGSGSARRCRGSLCLRDRADQVSGTKADAVKMRRTGARLSEKPFAILTKPRNYGTMLM